MNNRTPNNETIAVIDMDCLFAGATGLDAYWQMAVEARPGFVHLPDAIIDPVLEYDPAGADPGRCVTRLCGYFEPLAIDYLKIGIPPKTAAYTDRSILEVLHLAFRMLERAGYGVKADFDRTRARVSLGCGIVSPAMERYAAWLANRRAVSALQQSDRFASLDRETQDCILDEFTRGVGGDVLPFTTDSSMGSSTLRAAGRLANRLDFQGGCSVLSTTCASSLMTVMEGCRWLQGNECDLVLAGATDYAMATTQGLMLFSAAGALTARDCRPFDTAADGTLPGIGCGLVLLKRLSDARRDNDPVRAIVRGGAIASDGRSVSITQPSVNGITRAIRGALSEAGSSFNDIGYIETHGTGTPLGDETELQALEFLVQECGTVPQGIAVGCHKQLIGHTHTAAGIAGLIKTVLTLENATIPPLKHIETPRVPLTCNHGPLHYVSEATRWKPAAQKPRLALVTALGFGGINSSLVVEESPQK